VRQVEVSGADQAKKVKSNQSEWCTAVGRARD